MDEQLSGADWERLKSTVTFRRTMMDMVLDAQVRHYDLGHVVTALVTAWQEASLAAHSVRIDATLAKMEKENAEK